MPADRRATTISAGSLPASRGTAPYDLTCVRDYAWYPAIRLHWTNGDIYNDYDDIDVFVNGVLEETIDGDSRSYFFEPSNYNTYCFTICGNVGVSTNCSPDCCLTYNFLAPYDLECHGDVEGMTLSWTNGEAYDSIEVWINSSLVETIAGTANSYFYNPPVPGNYCVVICGNLGAETFCSVECCTDWIGMFGEGPDYSIPSGSLPPPAVALGDLDEDSYLDIVVPHGSEGGRIFVLPGNGDGTFQAAVEHSVGSADCHDVAIGDFNDDGHLDLACAAYWMSSSVSVLLGNGDGSFTAATEYPVYDGARSIAVDDLNNDGAQDLVVGTNMGFYSVLTGYGDGDFKEAVNEFASGYETWSVSLLDLNGDDNSDLVLGSYGGQQIAVMLGDGDSRFYPPVPYTAGDRPQSVAIDDLNGDDIPDLVTVHFWHRKITGQLSILTQSLPGI